MPCLSHWIDFSPWVFTNIKACNFIKFWCINTRKHEGLLLSIVTNESSCLPVSFSWDLESMQHYGSINLCQFIYYDWMPSRFTSMHLSNKNRGDPFHQLFLSSLHFTFSQCLNSIYKYSNACSIIYFLCRFGLWVNTLTFRWNLIM